MRRYRIYMFLLFLFPCTLQGIGQLNGQLDSLLKRAERFYQAGRFDSALFYNQQGFNLIRANAQKNESLLIYSSTVLLDMGRCYRELKDYTKAHTYMTYALTMARTDNSMVLVTDAFVELNALHRQIAEKGISFPYPSVPVTEEVSMYFPISRVEAYGKDSILIRVAAGKLDGLTDSVSRALIIQRDSTGITAWPEGRALNCYVRKLDSSYIELTATLDKEFPVSARDLLRIQTMIPVKWRQLSIAPLLMQSVFFLSNMKSPLYHSRYLYYYADSLSNRDLLDAVHLQIKEVVTEFSNDTATNNLYLVKGDKGLFAGENVMLALSHTQTEHLRYFANFIKSYPTKYRSNRYVFSEIYATWVINNTPFADEDLRPFLLSQPSPESRFRMTTNFSYDIRDRDLISTWFNEGMLMANADNTDSSRYMADLLRDACKVLKDSSRSGWADYLEGYTWKKLGEYQRADSFFKVSLNRFKKVSNQEGENWASNALKNLKSSRDVRVQLQTGHLFQYLMAPSPNSRYLATAGTYDMMVKIWDMSQGRTVHSFTAHKLYITSISYSPDGRYLATASDDQTIKIWNAYDFSLLYTIERPETERSVIFTPDSRQLVAGGNDSLIKFIDFTSGKVVKTLRKHKGAVTSLAYLPTNQDYLFSAGTDSLVYKWNLQTNNWSHWYRTKGRNLQVSLSNNGKYMSVVSSDTLIHVWNLETNKFYFTIPPNYTMRSSIDMAFPAFSPDGNFLALSLTNEKLDLIRLKDLRERVYTLKNENSQGMFDLVFSPDGQYLAARMDMGGPIRLFNFSDWDFDNRPTIGIKEIRQYANAPLAVQFSRDDKSLFVVHEKISRLDLRNGSTSHLYEGAFVFMNNHIMLNDERTGISSDYLNNKLLLLDTRDHQEKLVLRFAADRKQENINRFDLSADNRYIFLGGEKGSLAGFRLPDGQPLFDRAPAEAGEMEIRFIRYDSIRQRLFVLYDTDSIHVADAKTGKWIQTLAALKPRSVEVTPRFIYVSGGSSLLYKYDAANLRLLKKIKLNRSGMDCYSTVMSHDYRYLVVQVGDSILALDTRSEKVMYERYDHDYTNGTMCISHNNRWLATGGFDSKVHLYDLVNGKKISNIYTPKGKDFLLSDSSGHYLAPKNSLEAVSFSFNNSSYGFEQFDTRFNRPDLVLKKIGAADSSLLRSFAAAWKKRLQKLRLTEKDLNADIHLPVTRLKDKFALKRSTKLEEYEISIECYDATYPLRALHVMVNNNPLFGVAGKPIGDNQGRSIQQVKIPLSSGVNQIKVFCTNERGTASLGEYIEINSIQKADQKPKTYFIGIAVSQYKDSSMNLQFAAKDVRDLTASFDSLYSNFEADTLINRSATRENILSLRQKLMNTTVNDRVIISVNGHGLLSDSLDFYYATWDMDFSKPAARGLKYEELEALLDGIPARKKLLLIDACHSGALDKEELLARQKELADRDRPAGQDTVKSFAARGTIIRNSRQATDVNSSFELMQNLFADISAGNGAVIISAAGGMEYAFESEKWNNGVFTYCVRKGIEEKLADKQTGNQDGLVDVGELKEYVSRKVSELTGGKQRPVSRQDNLDYRWYFW